MELWLFVVLDNVECKEIIVRAIACWKTVLKKERE